MNVCVVGSGPTAQGKGKLIDACDFVVRLKRFWLEGATDVGYSCNAIASYDYPIEMTVFTKWANAEFWITQTPQQLLATHDADWLEMFTVRHGLGVIRWLSGLSWTEITSALGHHPSTGFVAICMAMELLTPDVLTIVGFDQLTPANPNFHCARRKITPAQCAKPNHDFVAEKRGIAELEESKWLGKECHTKLVWSDKPDIPPPPAEDTEQDTSEKDV